MRDFLVPDVCWEWRELSRSSAPHVHDFVWLSLYVCGLQSPKWGTLGWLPFSYLIVRPDTTWFILRDFTGNMVPWYTVHLPHNGNRHMFVWRCVSVSILFEFWDIHFFASCIVYGQQMTEHHLFFMNIHTNKVLNVIKVVKGFSLL